MKKRQANRTSSKTSGKPASPNSTRPAGRLTGGRLWLARLAMVIVTPLLFFGLLELILRIAGVGYPMSFFLKTEVNGKPSLMQNERFGWRFFGKDMSRNVFPFLIPETKAPGTVRIFVFGESAAAGDPSPEFSFSRVLLAMLNARYPKTHFEIVNTGMPAINSHAILPIAREAAGHDGDVWVIYMGNNEVVGPYGTGSVFGLRGANLAVVRASLALKATRLGQWLGNAAAAMHPKPVTSREWGGMEMFMENRVRRDDPGMATVYANFERNLSDMLRAGHRAGVGMVLSTVASNLKDCGPFASQHRPDLTAADKMEWDRLYEKGLEAQRSANAAEAIGYYQQASKLDDTFADLHYRWGQCELALDKVAEGQKHYMLARDFDTLRFRADSRINEIIRQTAAKFEKDGVRLADAEKEFARRSPYGLAGRELLLEHVHLNFEGNFALATVVAEQVAKLLPKDVAATAQGGPAWASPAECERRLAFCDWNRYGTEADILGRMSDRPFTGQLDHEAQYAWLRQRNAQLAGVNSPAALQASKEVSLAAVAAAPDDWVLRKNLASVYQSLGDYANAAESFRKVTEMMPQYAAAWDQLGVVLAETGTNDADAIKAFHTALDLQPGWEQPMMGLGQLYERGRKNPEAIEWFEKILAEKPYWGPAHLELGRTLEAMGRLDEATAHYKEALKNRMNTPAAMNALAKFCFEKKWYAEAATNFADALRLDPSDAEAHLNFGVTLGLLGRGAESREHFAQAVQLNPNLAVAHARLGIELGRSGDDAGALQQFSEAVRLDPADLTTRLNFAIALMNQQRDREALEQFEEVSRRDPANALARSKIQELRARMPEAAHR